MIGMLIEVRSGEGKSKSQSGDVRLRKAFCFDPPRGDLYDDP